MKTAPSQSVWTFVLILGAQSLYPALSVAKVSHADPYSMSPLACLREGLNEPSSLVRLETAFKDIDGALGVLRGKPGRSAPESAVFGKDDRVLVKENIWPWTTIGKIESHGGICTATLVGECLALTAAHCLKFSPDGKLWPMTFTPRFAGQGYEAIDARLANGIGPKTDWTTPGRNIHKDWAIVSLRGQPGAYWGYQGVSTGRVAKGKVSSAGYSMDFAPGELSKDENVRMLPLVSIADDVGRSKPMLCYHADSFYGASGGPVMAGEGKNRFIVGINSAAPDGSLPNDSSECAMGVPADYFIETLKAVLKEPCP